MNLVTLLGLVPGVATACGSKSSGSDSVAGEAEHCDPMWPEDVQPSGVTNDLMTKCEAEALDAMRPPDSQECDADWVRHQLIGEDAVDCSDDAETFDALDSCFREAIASGRGAFEVGDSLGFDSSARLWVGITPLGEPLSIYLGTGADDRGDVWLTSCYDFREWPAGDCTRVNQPICYRSYRVAGLCKTASGISVCPR